MLSGKVRSISRENVQRKNEIQKLNSINKQLLDEVEHDIMQKPNSIIVLLYIFHMIHTQKQKY